MMHARFDDYFKKNSWCEAVSTATKLDNMMFRHMGGNPPYYMFIREHPKYRKDLRIFGEIAVVANHETKSTRTKIDSRGKVGMFVGYDTIYIKTQVFRLLRYYSPVPRNVARSEWATQNITHNMTSSIIHPYGAHSP